LPAAPRCRPPRARRLFRGSARASAGFTVPVEHRFRPEEGRRSRNRIGLRRSRRRPSCEEPAGSASSQLPAEDRFPGALLNVILDVLRFEDSSDVCGATEMPGSENSDGPRSSLLMRPIPRSPGRSCRRSRRQSGPYVTAAEEMAFDPVSGGRKDYMIPPQTRPLPSGPAATLD
jgi:hypothetical protein